jgi:hypothetical protein
LTVRLVVSCLQSAREPLPPVLTSEEDPRRVEVVRICAHRVGPMTRRYPCTRETTAS